MAMSPQQFAVLRALFHDLLEESPQHRLTRIEQIAAADAGLAVQLRDLLDRADRSAPDAPPLESQAAARTHPIGRVLGGRYRILRLLDEGGMGDVYLAERSDDIEQKVAVKMLRGHDASLIGRFVRERQILARLGHPHIAHLLDGGVSDAGVPWFAMEYVDGAFITDASDRSGLGLRARVAQFVLICHAVQFAHQNLVLHRDLKPSNILVDAGGVPKLLDFGIARLLDDGASVQRSQTVTMTPAYAAPEQLRGEPVTTASDIYQLGLVLHQLLAGVPAVELRRRSARAPAGAPMQRPSQACAQAEPADAERIARARGMTPARLRRALRGDLDRIVAKAVADDPRERYETAQALGDDLERWCAGLPVRAQRASFGYRTRKWLVRHAGAAFVIALFAIGLVAASVVAINRAAREHQQRQRAETVLGFMRDIFQRSDPQNGGRADTPAGDLLEQARAHLEARTDLDDVTRAILLGEIATALHSMGREASALPSIRRALDLLEPMRDQYPVEYLNAATTLIEALRDQNLVQEELAVVERVLPIARRTREGSPSWHASMLGFRGFAQMQAGDLDAAQATTDAAIAEFESHGLPASMEFATALYQRGFVSDMRGDLRAAVEFYRRVAAVLRESADATKINIMVADILTARALCALGENAAGTAMLTPLPGQLEALLGPAHNLAVTSRIDLAHCATSRGDYAAAADALRTVPDVSSTGTRPTDIVLREQSATRMALYTLHTDEALVRARAHAQNTSSQPLSPKYDLVAHWLLGEALLQAGLCAQAAPQLGQALASARTFAGGAPSPAIGEAEDSLGRCRLVDGDPAAARALFAQAVEHLQAAQSPGAAAIVRSRIHERWAELLATRDARLLDGFEPLRADLVRALGGEQRVQVWQFDLLLDGLRREFGEAGIEPARRARAESGLRQGRPELPHFIGLNSVF